MPDKQYTIRISTVADPSGLRETEQGFGDLQRSGVSAHSKIAEEAEHAHLKHRDLHAGVRALHEAFPQVAAVAHAFLNPLGLAVSGIVAAFTLWKERSKELAETLSGVELPKVSPTEIGHITAAAQAYERYADAIKKASDSYHSIDAASDRTIGKIKSQLEEEKKFLSVRKGMELANLESQKGSMSPDQYDQAKADIESRYGAAGVQAEQAADTKTLFQKSYRSAQLAVDSQAKLKQAAGIHIASAEDDTKTEADMKAQADAAEKEIEERRKRIKDLVEFQSGEGGWTESMKIKARQFVSGQSPEELLAMEQEGIGTAQAPIDRYHSFLRRKASREQLRKQRSELEGSAATEAGEAAGWDEAFPDELGNLRRKRANDSMLSAIGTAGDLEQHKAVTKESQEQLVNAASLIAGHAVSLQQATKMMDWAAKNMGNFVIDVMRLAGAMGSVADHQAELNARVSRLESRLPTRTMPGGNP
jgi:hypothetical protein